MISSIWPGRRLVPGIGLLALLVGGAARPAQGQAPAALAAPAPYPVQTPVRGYLAAVFVADGGNVKRGQLVAKLRGADGRAAYVNAPATGRISLVPPTGNGMLASHTGLGTIQVAHAP